MRTQVAKLRETIGSSLWFLPSMLVVAGSALAFLLVALEETIGEEAVRRLPLVFGAGPDGARGMLTAIAGSVLGLAGITFSTTLVALSIAAGTYTPRILRHFLTDRGNQLVLGTLLATFVYSLLVLRTIRAGEGEFVPSLAVSGAVVFALVDLGIFIYFIDHITQSIQTTTITENVTNDTTRTIETLFPDRIGVGAATDDVTSEPENPRGGTPVPAPRSGYIQIIDAERLLDLVARYDAVLWMERGIGDFVAENTLLATLSPPGRADDEAVRCLQNLYGIGKERSIGQDIGFGFRQLTDLALKALSPGINDVTTATTCIDRLGELLRYVGERKIPSVRRYDEGGRLRVIAKRPDYAELMGLAFDQIRVAGKAQSAVILRMLRVIQELAEATDSPNRRRVLLEHATLIRDAADAGLDDRSDREQVRRQLNRLAETLADAGMVGTL